MLNQQTLLTLAGNPNFKDLGLLAELTELFTDRQEAVQFLYLYGQVCEVMDDLVDETNNAELLQKYDQLRMDIQHCPYWVKHSTYLWAVERLIHNTYFDSVKWERSTEEWKQRDARCLSHCAYNMLFSVILIEFGPDVLNKYSLRFREHAHLRHLNDPYTYASS